MNTRPVYRMGTVPFVVGVLAALLAVSSVLAAPALSLPIVWQDDFSGALTARWSWIREAPTHWSLSAQPGFLRLTTQQISGNQERNLLVVPAPAGDYEIETRVVVSPTQNYQFAGLLVYQDDSNLVQLGRAYCDLPATCVGSGIYFDRVEGGNFVGGNFAVASDAQYLKLEREGSVYTAWYSPDESNWFLIGTHTAAISPLSVGLKASNQGAVPEMTADFDYFRMGDESQRVYLPLVKR